MGGGGEGGHPAPPHPFILKNCVQLDVYFGNLTQQHWTQKPWPRSDQSALNNLRNRKPQHLRRTPSSEQGNEEYYLNIQGGNLSAILFPK